MGTDGHVVAGLLLTFAFSAGEWSRTRERRRRRMVLVRGPDILEERMRLPQHGEKLLLRRGRDGEIQNEGGREGGRESRRGRSLLVTVKGE